MMCLPIVLKIFGPCRGSQPGFVVVWKPSFSRGENVLSIHMSDPPVGLKHTQGRRLGNIIEFRIQGKEWH